MARSRTKYNTLTEVTGTLATSTTIVGTSQVSLSGNENHVIIVGTTDSGDMRHVPVTSEGHMEVAVHGPRLPFGSIHTENLYPEFQIDGVYGINPSLLVAHSTGSGNAYNSDGILSCSTGTTIYSFAALQSRRRLRYRPGQGVVGRFTGIFPVSASNSMLVVGLGSPEAGAYFGYNGTDFGILHSTRGKREIQTLAVQVASSTNENISLRLGNANYSVAVTNSGVKHKTAYEISRGTFAGWDAMALSESVVFISNQAVAYGGAFSGSGTTFSGSFTRNLAGSASFNTWVYQSDWNGDKLDGTGASGVIIDPKKGNVYQIGVQYLGYGAIIFQIETVGVDGNNPDWSTVHTLKFPNTRTLPNFSNPAFPFTMAAYSAGSTTDVGVGTVSLGGFIEGQKHLVGPRFTYQATATSLVTATAYRALLTARNDYVYSGRPNQAVVRLLSMAGAVKDTTPVTMYLIRNATLAGNPIFRPYASASCTSVDNEATTCTFTDNAQLIVSVSVGETGQVFYQFEDEVTLQPGETITLAARSTTGTSPNVLMSLNTREDH